MRLAYKIFLASSVVLMALLAVVVLSLRAIDRLVDVNREIAMQTVPALRASAAARDAILALGRLEGRYLVLGDPEHATLWELRAKRAQDDFETLRRLVRAPREVQHLDQVVAAFEEYRGLVGEERRLLAQGERRSALTLAETRGAAMIDRMETGLERLAEERHAAVARAQADAARLERRTWAGVLIALAAALGLALLSTAAIAFRITHSIRVLSEATAAVAAGSFTEPIRVQTRDEIGGLARAFNTMAARLRQMDETKQEFFARISHELRSPLTSVREAANLLRDGIAGDLNPKQLRLVDIVGQSSDRLLRLVNQLLDLSRMRAGLLEVVHEHVDLARVIDHALEELRPQAQEAGVVLSRDKHGANFVCMGDEDRLVQVVVNLVGNAIRFTPPGGSVTVRLVDEGATLILHVEDTGVGIPESALATIFDAYQQAHRDRGGTGLGLAIARGTVEAHGGRVTVESKENVGSRFTVVLPRGSSS
jgi:signal transduction histidine kinase